ncbi:MAG TPA: hypothetical protein VGL81_18660 [Polyangiaceae bacterium]|jgi:hypothetical protein
MRAAAAALLGVVAAGLAVPACSYDWAVPADAGVVEASAVDAAEAGKDVTAPEDAPADVPGMDAPIVMEAAPLPPCTASDEMPVQQARTQALVCTGVMPSPCETTVTDECGCPFYAATTNMAESDYVMAVKQLLTTCVPSCASTCAPLQDKGICLITDAGGTALACVD